MASCPELWVDKEYLIAAPFEKVLGREGFEPS